MTLLDFNELGTGQQVGLQTTDRGVISGTAVPASASSVSLGFIAVGAGAQSFNGDGSAGANALSSITTLRRTGISAAGIVWNFLPAGVTTGALVFFSVEGLNAGELTLQNNGSDLIVIDSTNPSGSADPTEPVFPALVFDGTNWRLVHSRIQIT